MTSDLIPIFGLTKKQLKWYIKGWVRKKSKSFDFNKWWANEFITFTFVSKMFSKLISSDLVSVTPMGTPTGNLFHYDFRSENMENSVLTAEYNTRVAEYQNQNNSYIDDLRRLIDDMPILEYPFAKNNLNYI